MKKYSVFLRGAISLLALGLVACSSPKGPVNSGDDETEQSPQLNIPDGFNFETTKGVSFNVGANQIDAERAFVSIYDKNPTLGGIRLQQITVEGGSSYTTLLTLPTHLNSIWIEALDSNGYIQSHEIQVTGESANLSLESRGNDASTQSAELFSSEDCNSGCDSFASNGLVSIDGNTTICVAQGDIWTGQLSFENDGGRFKTCGESNFTGNILYVNDPDNVTVYVTDTGELNGGNLLMGSSPVISEVINYGDIDFTDNLNGDEFTFNNFGSASFGGALVRISENSALNNSGTFTSTQNFQHRGEVTNTGSINVTANYVLSQSFELDNQCTVTVGGDFTATNEPNTITNSGFLDITGLFNISNDMTFNVGNSSYVRADQMNLRGDITGPVFGNYGRFDALDSPGSNVFGSANITNRVDICDLSTMTVSGGATVDPSVTVCTAYIPPTSCVPEVGTLSIPDEYPGDPLRFYNNPFPAEGEYGTLMYEDLWPSFGDYDMNDLVIAYNINLITNLQNEVVDIEFDMIIRALGAAFDSGFGIEFPVAPSRVQEVNNARLTKPGLVTTLGNGVEDAQTNAVVILWDDSGHVMRKWTNTVDPADHVDEDYITISMTFDPPVPIADLGTVPFNPFIFIDNNRGLEVHLPGTEPTDLADPSFFGEEDDTTDPLIDRYYLSETDLNWAINVPILIPYPLETINILDAYNKFQSWAESGGVVDTDWYLPFSGNRNNSQMYIGPDLTPPVPFGPPPIPGAPTPGN